MEKIKKALLLLALLPALTAPLSADTTPPAGAAKRDKITLTVPGFRQITPVLFISGQPSKSDAAQIERAGIKDIFSVRADGYYDNVYRDEFRLHIEPLNPDKISEPSLIIILKVLAKVKEPMLMHDMTGRGSAALAAAVWRVILGARTADAAANELKQWGASEKALSWFEKADFKDIGDRVFERGKYARPAKWAKHIDSPCLSNFYKVSDHIYRSEQPRADAMREFESMGIKNILNLRGLPNVDKGFAQGTSLKLYESPVKYENVDDGPVIRALKIISSCQGPVLIHCMHGSDRTGLVCAMSRILFEGWSKEDAVSEFENGNFEAHYGPRAHIRKYIENVDIEKIKKAVAAEPVPQPETP